MPVRLASHVTMVGMPAELKIVLWQHPGIHRSAVSFVVLGPILHVLYFRDYTCESQRPSMAAYHLFYTSLYVLPSPH